MLFTKSIHHRLDNEQGSNPQTYTQDRNNRKRRKTLSRLKELTKGDLKKPGQVKCLSVFIGTQSWEENDITNICSAREKNNQAINANTQATRRRHTVLKC